MLQGEEENGSRGFRQAIEEHLDWLGPAPACVVITNTYWLGEDKPCIIAGLRGVLNLFLEVKGHSCSS